MKKSTILSMLSVACIAVYILTGCQGTGQKEKKVETEAVSEFDIDSIKDIVITMVKELPQQSNINNLTTMMAQAKISYIEDLGYPLNDSEKLLTTAQMALGAGIYSSDYLYAAAFNRIDKVAELRESMASLLSRIGLPISKNKYTARVTSNITHKDSIDNIVSENIHNFHSLMPENINAAHYAYFFIAANMEYLYIISSMAELSKEKSTELEYLNSNTQRIAHLYKLLELLKKDSNISETYEGFGPIAQAFAQGPATTDNIKEIAAAIKKVRNNILK